MGRQESHHVLPGSCCGLHDWQRWCRICLRRTTRGQDLPLMVQQQGLGFERSSLCLYGQRHAVPDICGRLAQVPQWAPGSAVSVHARLNRIKALSTGRQIPAASAVICGFRTLVSLALVLLIRTARGVVSGGLETLSAILFSRLRAACGVELPRCCDGTWDFPAFVGVTLPGLAG